MKKDKLARISIEFEKNLNKLYPHHTSMLKKTQELNKELEKMLFGKKK